MAAVARQSKAAWSTRISDALTKARLYALWMRLPHYAGLRWTPRRVANFYLSRFDELQTRTKLRALPLELHLEINNTCNLHCPGCMTGLALLGRPKEYMSVEQVAAVFDEVGDTLLYFEPYVWGDPLVHPQIGDIIRLATRRGIATLISTNLSMHFTPERANDLVASGVGVIGVAIDGATQDTYEQYRRGGDLSRVLANLAMLVDAKRAMKASHLRIAWEYHLFPHNLHEVEQAHAMAAALGIEFYPTKGWVIGADFVQEKPLPAIRCYYLWQHATIRGGGGMSACCGSFNAADDLGDVRDGVMRAWNDARFQEARALFRNRDGATEPAKKAICYECPVLLTHHGQRRHVADGGRAAEYIGDYLPNDGYNFVLQRAARSAITGNPIKK